MNMRIRLRGALDSLSPTSEVAAGLRTGLLFGLAALVLCVPPHGGFGGSTRAVYAHDVATPTSPPRSTGAVAMRAPGATAGVTPDLPPAPSLPSAADFGTDVPSVDARRVADWVAHSGDNQQRPFAVLDKRNARVFVFDGRARLNGSTLVLLGSAPGDDSAPDIGNRPLSAIHSDERTTPAGRFLSVPGHDETGDDVVWVDYDNAVAMHRVKVVDPKERRFERIATDSIDDKRISNGCINVPVAFYDRFIAPTLGRAKAHVYILPEVKALAEVFPALDDVAMGNDARAAAADSVPADAP